MERTKAPDDNYASTPTNCTWWGNMSTHICLTYIWDFPNIPYLLPYRTHLLKYGLCRHSYQHSIGISPYMYINKRMQNNIYIHIYVYIYILTLLPSLVRPPGRCIGWTCKHAKLKSRLQRHTKRTHHWNESFNRFINFWRSHRGAERLPQSSGVSPAPCVPTV